MTELALYEIFVCAIHGTYWRSYVWATSEDHAHDLFAVSNPDSKPGSIRRLFGAGDPPFATVATDHGWPDEDD